MPMWFVFGVQSSAMLTGVLPALSELALCSEPQPLTITATNAAATTVAIKTLLSCFTCGSVGWLDHGLYVLVAVARRQARASSPVR